MKIPLKLRFQGLGFRVLLMVHDEDPPKVEVLGFGV